MVHCLLSGYGLGKGTVYFDDVALTPIGSTNNLASALTELRNFAKSGGEPPKEMVRKNKPDSAVHERGLAIFNLTCVACHGVDGKGVPETFPPLDGSDWVTGDPTRITKIVLHGLMGEIKVGEHTFNSVMAPLGPALDDQQISDVITYVRQTWSNDAEAVSPDLVKKVRRETADQTMMYQAEELRK